MRRAVRCRLSRSELYGATVGGLRLDDPGVDLAVSAALASACEGRPPPAGMAFVGEVSLSGTVRPVAGMDQRLSAGAAAGLEIVVGPFDGASSAGLPTALRMVGVRHVREALSWRSWRDGRGCVRGRRHGRGRGDMRRTAV